MTMVQEQEKEKDEGRRERKDSTRRSRRDSTRSERDADEHKERHHHRERDKRKSRGSDDDRERDRDKRSRDKDGHRTAAGVRGIGSGSGSGSGTTTATKRNTSPSLRTRPSSCTPSLTAAAPKPEFDVISGPDAVAFARKFVRDQAASGADVPAASLPPPLLQFRFVFFSCFNFLFHARTCFASRRIVCCYAGL
ncbi:hypothetical protein B0H14DRAFT_3865880 [Mycena olivaceomarginata]|nr:hypothetical protein B0H14DRAFT_3865880 [Mycena olivaceomarginata]